MKTIIITLAVICSLFSTKFSFANGATGHLLVGHSAAEMLRKSGHKRTSEVLLKLSPEHFYSGLVFPDAMQGVGGDRAHNPYFLNEYVKQLIECKKETGGWTTEKTCREKYAHFFGVLLHVATDEYHDSEFLTSVIKEGNGKKCAKWNGNTNGCSHPTAGLPKSLSCKGKGIKALGGWKDAPGSQFWTDVLVDYELYPDSKRFRPKGIVDPKDITKVYSAVNYKVKSSSISKANKDYEKDILKAEGWAVTVAGIDPAKRWCPSINPVTHKGGINDASKKMNTLMGKVIDILVSGKTPIFEFQGIKDKKNACSSEEKCKDWKSRLLVVKTGETF